MLKLALLFPGSGAQYAGMCRSLYDKHSIVKDTFQEADDILGYEFSKIILKGNVVKLNKIENVLLSVYVASVAYFRLYMEIIGVYPNYMAGHSLGEYSALTCSKTLLFNEGVKLVQLRSQLAQQVVDEKGGTMTILKNILPDFVKKTCDKVSTNQSPVTIACYNSPKQVLISGNDEAVRTVESAVLNETKSAEIINLFTSPPYHSNLLKSKVAALEEALDNCFWGDMKTTVISNITGLPYKSTSDIKSGLIKQLYNTVQWEKTMLYLQELEVNYYVEMGPQNLMKNILLDINDQIKVHAFDEKLDRAKIIEEISPEYRKNEADKKQRGMRLKAISMCLTHAISTRNYNDNGEYDPKSLEYYNLIKELKEELVKSDGEITDQSILSALEMLDAVFISKKTPKKERKQRKEDILNKTGIDEVYKLYEERTERIL